MTAPLPCTFAEDGRHFDECRWRERIDFDRPARRREAQRYGQGVRCGEPPVACIMRFITNR